MILQFTFIDFFFIGLPKPVLYNQIRLLRWVLVIRTDKIVHAHWTAMVSGHYLQIFIYSCNTEAYLNK